MNIHKKELLFSFVSDGTVHQFAAFKFIVCPYEKKKRHQLDMYRDMVEFRDSPTVYILDNTGNILPRR